MTDNDRLPIVPLTPAESAALEPLLAWLEKMATIPPERATASLGLWE